MFVDTKFRWGSERCGLVLRDGLPRALLPRGAVASTPGARAPQALPVLVVPLSVL